MLTDPIELAERQAALVQRCIAAGRFDSVGEAVRAGLSLLEERIMLEEAAKDELRRMLDEAVASGVSDLSLDEVMASIKSRRFGNVS